MSRILPELVVDYFHSLPGPHSAVAESPTGWYWLNDLLGGNGIELVLAHAEYLKAIAYAKVKTDNVDSQTLPTLLRQNLIPRAHKISRELRGLRDTMRIPLRLVQQRAACLRRIESIAGKFNTSSDLPVPYAFQLSVLHYLRDTFTATTLDLEISLRGVLIPTTTFSASYACRASANSLPLRSIWRLTASNDSYPINISSRIVA